MNGFWFDTERRFLGSSSLASATFRFQIASAAAGAPLREAKGSDENKTRTNPQSDASRGPSSTKWDWSEDGPLSLVPLVEAYALLTV
jgi:hypothetical protein